MTGTTYFGIFLLIPVVLVLSGFAWHRGRDPDLVRSSLMARLAKDLDWSYSRDDVFDYANMPFILFRERDGRACNVLVGSTHDANPVCAFDYTLRIPMQADARRYSCVVTDIGATCRPLLVAPDSPDRRNPPLPQTEICEMHPYSLAGFVAWSQAPEPVLSLIDSRFTDWLSATWPDAQFEVAGSLMLVWSEQQKASRVGELFNLADALRTRLVDVTTASLHTSE